MNTTLKKYIEKNLQLSENSPYYNESFCNLVLGYYGEMGDMPESDIEYLNSLGYSQSDFMDEENMSAIDEHEKEFGADGYKMFPGNR